MSQPISNHQRQLFVLFLLALLAAGKVIEPCLDWDTWWHLRVGQYIVVEQNLPDYDPFSQLGQEEHTPWVAYSWLYELLLYGCFQTAGAAGVIGLRYLLVMLSWGGIGWFLLRHARSGWIALGLLALVTISLRPFSPERPWHFTIFFTTLTLHAVICVREGSSWRRFWVLPILYVLWANIHIQFVMGFAVLGLAWLAALAEQLKAERPERRMITRQLFWLGLSCALATLLTPFHLHLYRVIWEYATQTKALALVMELQPPDYSQWYNWPMIVLALMAVVVSIRRGLRIWDLLLLASGCLFSMRMQRDLWYGVLAASAVIVQSGRERPESRRLISAWTIFGMSALAAALISIAWQLVLSKGKTIAMVHEETYPVKAVEFIREQRLPGPLFNTFDWGGYLIWALPERPVSMDGRTNLYGEERLIRSMDTWSAEPGWENDPDLQKSHLIIAPKKRSGKELAEALKSSPRWLVKYEDDTAVVFVPK